MAHKVDLYDVDTYNMKKSEREYVEFTILADEQPDPERYETRHSRGMQQTTVFQDLETGLLVMDVSAFESWMEKQ